MCFKDQKVENILKVTDLSKINRLFSFFLTILKLFGLLTYMATVCVCVRNMTTAGVAQIRSEMARGSTIWLDLS